MSACGTLSAYRKGCRCDACKEVKAENRRRHQRTKNTGEPPGVNLTAGGGYTITATCPKCAGDLEHETSGRPTDAGTEVRAVARCTRNGCRRRWLFVVTVHPFHVEEIAA